MSAVPKSDEWKEFFHVYGRLPALWKASDEVYKNKKAKIIGYERLLKCYQKIYPDADADSMKRKLNGIRACFRRELRKVERSERKAKFKEDVYVPTLWYYKEMCFLRNDIRQVPIEPLEETNDVLWDKEDSDEEPMDDTTEHKDIITMEHTPLTHSPSPLSTLNIVCPDPIAPRVEQQPIDSQARDEATIFAEGWVLSYRKLDEHNKLLAKKAIDEILVLGQLNKLQFNSVRMPQ